MGVRAWVVAAAVLGSGIVFLDSSVVAVALPRIGETLPVHLLGVLEGQSYIYTGYLLALSALLIPAGAMTDSYGRRRTFALGLVGFGFTSVLCGLAPTMEWLVAFRVLQGGAGALLVPGSLSLIRATMLRTPHALVPSALFRSRAFTIVNLATFLIYGALTSSCTTCRSSCRGRWGTRPPGPASPSCRPRRFWSSSPRG
ncbi:MAG: MFS transporter [Armatimonadota bacterium]|nr:MFS transporter [Armatimonadota bacterium]MDR7485278.1 MFS transporter [Armatimonadota bacterium]MDR7533884.1 MFS transporter [Armatimonadota bacterium]MDR7537154.1 MFS transporter [Armatimonadota bacterium]